MPSEKGAFFNFSLKACSEFALLTSSGNAFHSFVATQVKDRSPSVDLD